jgi:hypothetical protein
MTQLRKTRRRNEKAIVALFTETLANVLVQTISRICEFLLVIVEKSFGNGFARQWSYPAHAQPVRRG